ncbi:hypothetical protein D044_4791A, partial [Vibrio parahaemolyticus EKP-026]|jgi:hypothetical protein
MSLP